MRTVTIDIEGMTCGGCAASVRDSLLLLEKVTDVTVDLRANQATVVVEDMLPEEAVLNAAVAHAGYRMVPGRVTVAEKIEDPRFTIPKSEPEVVVADGTDHHRHDHNGHDHNGSDCCH